MEDRKRFNDVFVNRVFRVVHDPITSDIQITDLEGNIFATVGPDDLFDYDGNRFAFD